METIIIISIICLTLIALAGCVLSYFRIKTQQPANKTSYIFWGSVIACISVLIYSHCYCGNDKVLDFFSLASAIISIILAIITIVYSFYTNSRSNGQSEILNRAAQDVQKASQSYSESAESLEENISKIISAINRVEAKTDKLLVHSLSDNSSISNVIPDTLSYSKLDNVDAGKEFDIRKYIQTFVAISSPLGILSMYACIQSKDKSIPFPLDLLSDSEDSMYCAGFLIATTGTGIINTNIDFSIGIVRVTDYVTVVKDDILEWLRVNSLQGPLKELKDKIDTYFLQDTK